jgi:anion-transporting  ArsA/GET3 family ATPase
VDRIVLDAPATGHGLALLEAPRLVADVIADGPIGRAAAELSAFVSDPAACGVVVVAAPEEIPVHEALELIGELQARFGRRPEAVVVNGVYPEPPVDRGGAADPIVELWRDRRTIHDRELRRLAAAWDGPRVEVPLLPLDRGPALAAAVEERLSTWIAST